MSRPYIVCHMMQSLDGRVACDMVDKISGDEYYEALDSFGCKSHIEGKCSYQIHYCGFEEFKPKSSETVGQETFHIARKCEGYSISADSRGTLLWEDTDNDSRLCIVSEQVSPEYLEYLRDKGISYIAAGKAGIDLVRAMAILHDEFGVDRLAVVGGGRINGGFLAAGLIDEVSAMLAPGIDGRCGQPALFDGIEDKGDFLPKSLKLQKVSTFENGVVWLKYTV